MAVGSSSRSTRNVTSTMPTTAIRTAGMVFEEPLESCFVGAGGMTKGASADGTAVNGFWCLLHCFGRQWVCLVASIRR